MKRTKIFRGIATFLVAATAIVSLAGCSKKVERDDNTIAWLGAPYYPSLVEGGYAEKLIESKFGVNLIPVAMDSNAYEQTKPLQFANGDIPDVVYEMDPKNVKADVKQGFLAEVPLETIAKYAPNYFKNLTETLPQVWSYSDVDGKNYGLPNLFYTGDYPTMGLWRKDWLDNLGIEKTPETLDEMHDALYKMRYGDPDGNGKMDTYGMTGNMEYYFRTFPEIFGAYNALPFNWVEKDGEIVYGGLQPEVKDALATLAQWYQEGIIDPDFITDSTDNVRKKFSNGKIGYMYDKGHLDDTYNESDPSSVISTMKKINPNAEIEMAVLPKNENGDSGAFVWSKAGHIICFGKQLEDQPEKLAKILEIIEYMYTNQDFLYQVIMGEEGVHYEKDTENGGVKYIAPYTDAKVRNKDLPGGINATCFWAVAPVLPETYEKNITNAGKERYEIRKAQNGVTDYFLKVDAVPDSDKYYADITTQQMVVMAEIIRGEKPVSAYDEFINTTYAQFGGKELSANAKAYASDVKAIIEKCEGLIK